LLRLYNENPEKWVKEKIKVCAPSQNDPNRVITLIAKEDIKAMRKLFKRTSDEKDGFGIRRAQKGYGALISYLDNYKIEKEKFRIYVATTLMILSSLFGSTYRFRENRIIQYCGGDTTLELVYKVLENLLSDRNFERILLVPNEDKSS